MWLGRARGLASWDEVLLVVDRRLKGVVGRGSAAEVGRWSWLGRGWVVAPVMTFFEWVCSGGFQIVVGSWSWFAPVVFGFQIGSGDDFFLSAWVCVCLCFCLWFVLEVEGA